jgi:SagB-type dehydrogenase family enzyme
LFETIRASSYRNDLDNDFQGLPYRVSLHCCTYNIEGLPNGTYIYDESSHALKTIQSGDFRSYLQNGLLSEFVNMAQIPLFFNIVSDKDHYKSAYGYRGHRIQHMEAGILSHRLLLAASALNMGGHPILGFDVRTYDYLYQLNDKEKTSLLQIPIGYYRPHPRLQGCLHN